MLARVRSRGVRRFVLLATLLIVLGSESMMVVVLQLNGGFSEPEFWQQALLWSGLIPAVVAPPALAFMARLVLHLDRTRTVLRDLASTDVLTGIHNRRGFFDAATNLVATAAHDTTFEIGMVDLDRFKALNDRFGHARGDDALVLIARWLNSVVGERGVVGRIGGDEFSYVVPVSSAGLPDRVRFDLDGIDVSVTIGRVCSQLDGGIDASLSAADQALYLNKQDQLAVESLSTRLDADAVLGTGAGIGTVVDGDD